MARSKSPAPRKSKKSASKAAVAAPNEHVPLAATVIVLLIVWYLSSESSGEAILKDPVGDFSKSTLAGFDLEKTLKTIPYVGPIKVAILGSATNFVLLMHLLNTIDGNNNGGFWLNAFAQFFIAAYGSVIVIKILNGGNIGEAIFSSSVPNAFFIWYLITKEIPFCPADFGYWAKFKKFGGEALENLLALGTDLFITQQVIIAVGSPSSIFTEAWFKAIAMGAIAGTAGNFFPFNKGVKFARSEEMTNALAVSFFLASDGYLFIDNFANLILGPVGVEKLPFELGAFLNNNLIDNIFGGDKARFVMTVTVVNFLFGDILSGIITQVPMSKGFDMFGVAGKLFHFAQLD
jgi:hypothetical protein